MERNQESTQIRVLNQAFDAEDEETSLEYVGEVPLTQRFLQELRYDTERVLEHVNLAIILKKILSYYSADEIKADLEEVVQAIKDGRGNDYNFDDDDRDRIRIQDLIKRR